MLTNHSTELFLFAQALHMYIYSVLSVDPCLSTSKKSITQAFSDSAYNLSVQLLMLTAHTKDLLHNA